MSELWTPADAAHHIAVPKKNDDKYSRGVLGVITGSTEYPGAAVLGVEAAARTGIGMVRYLGPGRSTRLVLQRRPEVVTRAGRVQAWLLGSGMDATTRTGETASLLASALANGAPVVLDAGALDLLSSHTGPVIITPHYRELSALIGVTPDDIASDPEAAASRATDELGVTVLLKGHQTYVAGPGIRLVASSAPSWLATAGAGDALGGILGALVATHASAVASDATMLARLGATAAVIHGLAAERASNGGPLTIIDLAQSVSGVIGDLLRG